MEARGYLIIILREAKETETTAMCEEKTIPYGQMVTTLNALEMITNKETDLKKKKNTKRKTMTFPFGVGEKNKTKTKMKKAILLFLFASTSAIAQVGINTSTPDASAALDVESTTGGFLPPRMTQAQREAISNPANGLTVYQTDGTSGLYTYDSDSWGTVTTSVNSSGEITQISSQSPTSLTYIEALNYCKQLTENGFDDWRLGTFDDWNEYIENATPFPTSINSWVKGQPLQINAYSGYYPIFGIKIQIDSNGYGDFYGVPMSRAGRSSADAVQTLPCNCLR